MVAALEDEYRKAIAPALQHSGQGMAPADFFTWAVELTRVRPQIQGLEHWEQIEHQMIAPHVNQVMQALSRHLTGTAAEQWEAWRDRYVPQLLTLLGGLRREATERSRAKTASVSAALDPLLPEAKAQRIAVTKSLVGAGEHAGRHLCFEWHAFSGLCRRFSCRHGMGTAEGSQADIRRHCTAGVVAIVNATVGWRSSRKGQDPQIRYLRLPISWLKLLMALPNQDPLLALPRSPLVGCFGFDESSLARSAASLKRGFI